MRTKVILTIAVLIFIGVGFWFWASINTVQVCTFEIVEIKMKEDPYYEQSYLSALDSVEAAQQLLKQYEDLFGRDSVYYQSADSSLKQAQQWLRDVQESRNFMVEVTIKVINKGILEAVFKERQTTLYINGINIGTLDFAEEWERLPSGYSAQYTANWISTKKEDSQTLFKASSYDIIMKFKSIVTSGFYSSYMEKQDTKHWVP